MTDLLIRNIDAKLKRRLEARARRSGRSLSEEAKAMLSRGMVESRPRRPVGTTLVNLFKSAGPVALDVARDEVPRRPPTFE